MPDALSHVDEILFGIKSSTRMPMISSERRPLSASGVKKASQIFRPSNALRTFFARAGVKKKAFPSPGFFKPNLRSLLEDSRNDVAFPRLVQNHQGVSHDVLSGAACVLHHGVHEVLYPRSVNGGQRFVTGGG